MDKSKINQTELSYSCGAGNAKVNLYTGRLFFEHPEISIGLKTYNLTLSHIYNSQLELPVGINTYVGNQWKLNIQQYLYQEGLDYCYIDGGGQCITFKQLTGNIYYDTSGLGLKLYKYSDYSEIQDTSGGKMIFENNRLVKTISGENISIEKIYEYRDDQLVSFYDSRKPDHKIILEYNHNLLDKISIYQRNSKKYEIKYEYDTNQQLIGTTKIVKGVEEKIALFSYSNLYLNYAILMSDQSAIKITYSNDKVSQVDVGIASIGTRNVEKDDIYVKDDLYTNDNHYLGEKYNEIEYYIQPSIVSLGVDKLTHNKITYSLSAHNTHTIVENEQKVKMVYYLNQEGFTVSVLESMNDGNTDLKTLKKMPGWSMLNENGGTDSEKINTHNAFILNTSDVVSTNNGSLMYGRLNELKYYRENMHTNFVNYKCSFWLKLLDEVTNPKVRLTVVSKDKTDTSEVYFDNSAIDSWQEVKIPITILYDDLKSIKLEFLENNANKSIKIADMKLYYESTYNVMLTDGTNWGYLDDVTKIKYIPIDNPEIYKTVHLDDNTYITDQDLQMTYLNRFKLYGNSTIVGDFPLYYNDCTSCMMVKSAYLCTADKEFPIAFGSDDYNQNVFKIDGTRAQYYIESLSPDNNIYIYNIPHFFKQYQIGTDSVECMCMITEGNRYVKYDDTGDVPKDHVESYTITCVDLKGKKVLEQDEYGVQNIYKYDVNGILMKQILTNVKEGSEKIVVNTTTSDTSESINDGIVQNDIYYDETNSNILKMERYGVEESKSQALVNHYEYNEFNDQMKSVKNNFDGINYIKYDKCGRIIEATPKKYDDYNYYGYKFTYSQFGDPTKFFFTYRKDDQIIDNLLVQKIVDRLNNEVTTEYYREASTHDSTTITMDKYGRTNEIDIDGTKVKYTRQQLWESAGAGNLEKLEDNIEEKIYDYTYDEFNNLQEYGWTDNDDGSKLTVKKDGDNTIDYHIKYKFDSEQYSSNLQSELTYDNNIILSPRVDKTTYRQYSNKLENMIAYHYDDFGRINKKESQVYVGDYIVDRKLLEERCYRFETNLLGGDNVVYSCPTPIQYDFGYDYDERGNLKQSKLVHNYQYKFLEVQTTEYIHDYEYNGAEQLVKEYDSHTNTTKEYSYNTDGSINSVSIKRPNVEEKIEKYIYKNGKLSSISLDGNNKELKYDNIGNICKLGTIDYNWKRGNLLKSYSYNGNTTKYYYNGFGKKYKKELSDGTIIKYYYDNEKLIAENWSNGIYISYLYDLEGIIGFTMNKKTSSDIYLESKTYYYVKDQQGNVVSIIGDDKELGHYEYDAFGNCRITKCEDEYAVQLNPIRWKGLYCETESNLYFMNHNTYSPEIRQHLSMNVLENVVSNSTTIYSLYPYQISNSNPINILHAQHTIVSELELVFVPKAKSMFTRYWEKFWRSPIGKVVAIRLTMIALVLAIVTGNIVGFLITLGMVIGTLLVGGIKAGIRSKRQGKGGWNGFVNYINDNWSQTIGVEMAIFIVSIGVSQLFKNCYTDCFIAGTMVLTSIGLVKIEDVKVGDEVWAYDEETKEKALKKVKQLFRKETKEWMHLFVENPITKRTEEIICTPSHRIYIEGKGWIKASDIVESDEVLLYNNTSGIIQRIELERLEQPEVTYNFEVEDYHNYFVSEESVLVHNDCEIKLYRAMSNEEYGSLTKHKKFILKEGKMAEKFMATNYDDALSWGTKFYPDGNFRIVEIRVPTKSLYLMKYYSFLDDIGTAYSAYYKYLNSVMKGFARVL